MGSTDDGQYWQRWAALAMGNTGNDGAALAMGSKDDRGQHQRWAAKTTAGSTDDG